MAILKTAPDAVTAQEDAVTARDVVAADLEDFRRPLLAYCYRMLGSHHEAEDAVQETMIRAWRGLARLDGRAGLRAWLYKIATNVCLDALGDRRGRALPMDLTAAGDARDALGPALADSTWVRPIPTQLVGGDDPLERAVSNEWIRLAFVAALQVLLPRQRAVLILRDVLCWRAAEVASLLDTSVDAVNSTLRRARAALAQARGGDTAPLGGEAVDPALLARYVDAFVRFDVDGIVAMLRQDAVVSMPPYAFWLRGRDVFGDFLRRGEVRCRYTHGVVTGANGVSAVAMYDPTGAPGALHVLEWHEGWIAALYVFLDPALVPPFTP
ncbi:RNA polymerase subunit sigma-70 [Phytohabitans houttuyneae]|uniref:DNA-directed RNA polymerase sigma-70 factor n=1 Tax=Phytohabitans houttuyneae TaxID=1076126 RepID=A0A6V8KU60_9ACTN|nr:RNA polymerase subunit sigma-70 [Phytohabitans houttuyneae]GFJ84125.1 DNA-directed RNA polymerase sigma-70 factor [Phytohabitans houttuyneae]